MRTRAPAERAPEAAPSEHDDAETRAIVETQREAAALERGLRADASWDAIAEHDLGGCETRECGFAEHSCGRELLHCPRPNRRPPTCHLVKQARPLQLAV